jgi:hypothetical protein
MRKMLRRWLFPGFEEVVEESLSLNRRVVEFFGEIEKAKEALLVRGGEGLVVNGSLVLLGSLIGCRVEMNPILKPKIILSKLGLSSLLEVSGSNQTVMNSHFSGDFKNAAMQVKAEKIADEIRGK